MLCCRPHIEENKMEKVQIVEDEFGLTKQPSTQETEQVKRFTFTNRNGVTVQVITYGATITSIKTPDHQGNTEDVALGFDDMAGYLSNENPYFGATVGRVCNRIANAQFYLNGKEYKLAKNINGDHLHGGFIGFDKFNWTPFIIDNKVIMTHVSNDNYEGYPGAVIASVTFELTDENEFNVNFDATASKPTPINLTNHSYFNLAGHGSGSNEIYKHMITVNADKLTATNDESIPTGVLDNVGGTPFDLRTPHELGPAITRLAGIGYDDNFCITRHGESRESLAFVAEVVHPSSGRSLEVYSDQPGVQLYTSNYMPDPMNNIYPVGKVKLAKAPNDGRLIKGKGGAEYSKHSAFCLETQKFPDAVNHDNFPSVIVQPGEPYRHRVVYKFSVVQPIVEFVPYK